MSDEHTPPITPTITLQWDRQDAIELLDRLSTQYWEPKGPVDILVKRLKAALADTTPPNCLPKSPNPECN